MLELTMADYFYTVIFVPLEVDGYQVRVPAIPEIVAFGETIETVRAMAQDTIRCYSENSLLAGETIPSDLKPKVELLTITLY